uniref:Uncharacterized protein n=1 Tax=Knipowitschia caucasica TaxID=637954 RepID=A0AAV2LX64_KNICA
MVLGNKIKGFQIKAVQNGCGGKTLVIQGGRAWSPMGGRRVKVRCGEALDSRGAMLQASVWGRPGIYIMGVKVMCGDALAPPGGGLCAGVGAAWIYMG